MLTITLEPAGTGQFTATSSDGHTFSTKTPLLSGGRHWQQAGAPSTATIVTVWSSGSCHWSLRSPIGHAVRT
jgi:hypothetical protein